jgi:CheY-like chemotaxis protein
MERPITPASPATILVVDNDPGIRRMFAFVLQQVGYTVLTASSGEEAISLLTTTPIDLVLTDYEMPDMQGDALITLIKARQWSAKTILITGHRHGAQLAEHCGADGNFEKGRSIQVLLSSIATLVGGGTSIQRQ